MELADFYKELLAIDRPWQITKTEVDSTKSAVYIYLGHQKGVQFACPCCHKPCAVYDHQKGRIWRHLDTCQYQTYIKAQLPRINCSACGIKTVVASWSRSYSRLTDYLECHALDVLQTSQVIERSAVLLQLSADQLSYLIKKSVDRGVALRQACGQPINYVAIDEKAYKAGHHYVTILTDADNGRVLEVVADRTIESVRESYKSLNENQLATIKGISMDMWSPFESVSKEVAPQAAIVHDKFHLSAYLNNAVDITRRAQNKKLRQTANDLLKGTKYLWLTNRENLSLKETDLLDTILLDKSLKTVQAFQLKSDFKQFFKSRSPQEASDFFTTWHERVVSGGNAGLLKVATLFKGHLEGLTNYITHRISNGIAESLNSRIQQLKAKARGFSSPKAFRTAILFHFGKLHLYP